MTISPSPVRQRPLSPHLSIYKPQLTSGMSIFHKITGIGIGGGLIVFVAWLGALALGAPAYNFVTGLCTSIIGQIFFFGWTWALFYHLFNGVRHLLWAVGLCLTLPAIYTSGAIVLAGSALVPVALWAFILDFHKVVPWL